MAKVFTHLFDFIVGLIFIVQTCSAELKPGSKSQLPEPSYSGDINLALSCVLFGNDGCHKECIITSGLYNYKAYGSCTQDQNCVCIPSNGSFTNLRKLWKQNFDAKYVYDQIINNKLHIDQVEDIMSEPLTTGEQLKKNLESVLSPYQYSQLKVIDPSLACKLIKNDKIDEAGLREYISNRADRFWRYAISDKTILNVNYRKRFRQTLESVYDKGTLYNFAYKIARLKNKTLEEAFDEYLEDKKIEKPVVNLDEDATPIEMIHYLTIDEFIKRNNEAQKNNEKGMKKVGLVRSS